MIQGKTIRVTTNQGEYVLELTSQQIESTIRRRINTLVPGCRILDMHDVLQDQQHDLLTPRKRK